MDAGRTHGQQRDSKNKVKVFALLLIGERQLAANLIDWHLFQLNVSALDLHFHDEFSPVRQTLVTGSSLASR